MKFLINVHLGLFIVEAESATKALANYLTIQKPDMKNSFLNRKDLLKMGYKYLFTTAHKEVFYLRN